MDLCALNFNAGRGLALGTVRKVGLVAASAGWKVLAGDELSGGCQSEAREAARRSASLLRCRSIVVSAIGKKKNHDGASSSGENDPSVPEDSSKAKSDSSSEKTYFATLDWRDFRASLVAQELEHSSNSHALANHTISSEPRQMIGSKWAHPITVPENGCVLIATDKLDGVQSFERTVVLLLRLGSRDPREGPFGVILNKPLHKKIKHMKPSNPHLVTTFADCSLHRGGLLEANMFLLNTHDSQPPLPSFEKVVSGICFGARNSLDEAAVLINKGVLKDRDFRFFIGYAGWQFDQLLDEIDSGYWIVAACSSHLISGISAESSSDLWGETLQLMGGQYSELSQKPKQSNP